MRVIGNKLLPSEKDPAESWNRKGAASPSKFFSTKDRTDDENKLLWKKKMTIEKENDWFSQKQKST